MDFKQYVKLNEDITEDPLEEGLGSSLLGGVRKMAGAAAEKLKKNKERRTGVSQDPNKPHFGAGVPIPGVVGRTKERLVGAAKKAGAAAAGAPAAATKAGAATARTVQKGRAKYQGYKTWAAGKGQQFTSPKRRDAEGNVVKGKDGQPERDTTKTTLKHKALTATAAALAAHEGPLRTLVGGSGAPGKGKDAEAKAEAAAKAAANDTSGETRTDTNKTNKGTGAR